MAFWSQPQNIMLEFKKTPVTELQLLPIKSHSLKNIIYNQNFLSLQLPPHLSTAVLKCFWFTWNQWFWFLKHFQCGVSLTPFFVTLWSLNDARWSPSDLILCGDYKHANTIWVFWAASFHRKDVRLSRDGRQLDLQHLDLWPAGRELNVCRGTRKV